MKCNSSENSRYINILWPVRYQKANCNCDTSFKKNIYAVWHSLYWYYFNNFLHFKKIYVHMISIHTHIQISWKIEAKNNINKIYWKDVILILHFHSVNLSTVLFLNTVHFKWNYIIVACSDNELCIILLPNVTLLIILILIILLIIIKCY